ncbi:MAG: tetratricopeptide repeat protein [Gammaproteobacteria bacterium]|nr:tetratricopeptide repeat protein [Gammaproteobacteria bacterium]
MNAIGFFSSLLGKIVANQATHFSVPTLAVALLLLSTLAAAQRPSNVVESNPLFPGQPETVAPTANNDALQLLLDQNRQLQNEVQALRGMVEEQGFEIRKLQRDSLNRYTDIDERLRSLESQAQSMALSNPSSLVDSQAQTAATGIITMPESPTTPESDDRRPAGLDQTAGGAASFLDTAGSSADVNTLDTTPNDVSTANPALADTTEIGTATERSDNADPTVPMDSATNAASISTGNSRTLSSRGTLQPAVLSEQQLYQMAYNSVINSNFARSIAEFDQYLSIYPEGRFVTNVHYWKGQAFLYLDRFEEARNAYEIILDQYPDAVKVPDAMYGLALAYQGLGNVAQARQLLNLIKGRFPNTGVANLADTRLLNLN